MYDYRIVEQVSRKKKHMSGALRKVMVIFAVLFVLMGITISQAFMLPGFLLALLYFVYDIFSQRDYEYTMIIQEDGRKIKLLLDLTEEMLHTMKIQFPERVYFA